MGLVHLWPHIGDPGAAGAPCHRRARSLSVIVYSADDGSRSYAPRPRFCRRLARAWFRLTQASAPAPIRPRLAADARCGCGSLAAFTGPVRMPALHTRVHHGPAMHVADSAGRARLGVEGP
eukprot:Amastigsp_a176904_33.p3 type:complete len:121 gc:universal Amastigsp_a176904_33:1-363(+)